MKKIIFSIGLLGSLGASAQLRVGIESNNQYYVDDNKIKLEENEAKDRFRSNDYIKMDYNWKNFEFGLQVESYYPKAILNFNPSYEKANVGHVYARYRNYEKGVDITAGHMYEQFGSGLALRFWEDRTLGINNSLFGGRVKLDIANILQVKALAGKQRIGMGFDFSDGIVYGVDAELDYARVAHFDNNNIKVGATFVGRMEDITERYKNAPKQTFVFGPRVDYFGEKFNVNAEYLYKTADVHFEQANLLEDLEVRNGSAFLLNMGYNMGAFGLNVNLRRIENFSFYSQRNMAGNVYNYAMLNYIPALTKQYDHSLQNIYVYQAQPQYEVINRSSLKVGEIGGQFDMFYEAAEGSALGGETGANFAINGSIWSGLKTDPVIKKNEYDDEVLTDVKTSIFGVGERYYSDFAIEYRKTFSPKFSGIFSYLNQYYNSSWIKGEKYQVDAHTLSAEGTYFLSDSQSVRLELQHQWANEDLKNWAAGIIEYVPNPKWSFYVQDMYNYGNDHEDKQLHYYSLGSAFTTGSTRVAVSYGRQRGGTLCVGGVCRYVPENAGITLSITTNF